MVHQALAHRLRRIQVSDRRQKHPSSEFQRSLMPARVRSERTSLSNCAKAASTPSISRRPFGWPDMLASAIVNVYCT